MKSKKYKSTKQKILDAKPDEWAFRNLNNMKQEHKEMLGKHLIEIGYKLAKDKSGMTINDVVNQMKNVFMQIKKLKESYDKGL